MPTSVYADADDVRRLLERESWETTGLSDAELDAYLDDANLVIVEDVEPVADDRDINLSERRLAKIEAALAGHYVLDSGIDDLRQAQRRGSADGAFEWFGERDGTSLGQKAASLDPTGVIDDLVTDGPTAGVKRDDDRNANAVTPRENE